MIEKRPACRRALTLLLFTAALTGPAPAADFDLWLETSQDDAGIDTTYAELGITLDNGVRLDIGGGSTDYNDGGASVSPTSSAFGISAPLDQTFVPALRLDNWQAEGVMETSTLRLDLGYNLENWTLRASPLLKDITLRVNPPMGSAFDAETQARGFEASATWYGWDDWSLGLRAGGYSYDRDLSRLNTRVAARIFSEQALTSSSTLPERWHGVSLSRYTNWGALGLNYDVTTSAVTLSDAKTPSFNITLNLSDEVGLYGEVGETRLSDGSTIAYSRLALTVSW